MSNRIFECLRLSITFYVCISLIGCTSASYRQAQAYANREPKYWTIEDVTFAAIRDQRYIRMCVKLRHFSEEATTEVKFDINKIKEQLYNENNTVVSYEQGAKLQDDYHQEDEGDEGAEDELHGEEVAKRRSETANNIQKHG